MIIVSEPLATSTDSPLLTELTNSFAIDLNVLSNQIDGFGHVNNALYIQWLDQVHWAHLAHLGISAELIFEHSCGFVVHHTEVTYCAPLVEHDLIRVGTSIVSFDGSFRMTRKFQIVRVSDCVTALRGTINYVAVNLNTGRPMRVPREFGERIKSPTAYPPECNQK